VVTADEGKTKNQQKSEKGAVVRQDSNLYRKSIRRKGCVLAAKKKYLKRGAMLRQRKGHLCGGY